MKNNTLDKVNKQKETGLFIRQGSICGFWVLAGLFACQEGNAQFSNIGNFKVEGSTILSIHEDYENNESASFVNDGNVYIFKNWKNNGSVSFSNTASKGKTYFLSEADENKWQLQKIEGHGTTYFQNILFENYQSLVPFDLLTSISIGDKAEFKSGIINGEDKNALVIFDRNGNHEGANDLSFIDGKVKKIGKDKASISSNIFEYPVGDNFFYRPSFLEMEEPGEIYTTEYFFKNSDDSEHSHVSRDQSILKISDTEYWEVTENEGTEKIILSLTLKDATAPAGFYSLEPETKIGIVRWDTVKKMWVNEEGEVTNPSSGVNDYTDLITAHVSGYGLFTLAVVKRNKDIDDELIVYNAVSPNGDGLNDTFHIAGLNKFPDNEVEIYNRWGVKVYEAKGYNESDVMFGGYSDGRVTIKRGEKLPTGTYFYILKYNNGKKMKEKAGYLYINNQ